MQQPLRDRPPHSHFSCSSPKTAVFSTTAMWRGARPGRLALALLLSSGLANRVLPARGSLVSLSAEPLEESWLLEKSLQLAEVPGAANWLLLPYLWHEKTLNVTCPGQKGLSVFTARSEEGVKERVLANQQSTWCSVSQWAGGMQGSCLVSVSPFGTTHLAIAHSKSRGYTTAAPCQLTVNERLSPWMVLRGLLGSMLFLGAGTLSQSLYFRLGTGSLGFVLLSGLLLAFYLARSLPNKKTVAGAYVILGSSFTVVIEYLFGTMLPAFDQLLFSKVFLAYVVVAGLAGLATTYYFDSPENVKLLVILKYGLKLVGLFLVFMSVSRPDAAAALCALLVAVDAAHSLGADAWVLRQLGWTGRGSIALREEVVESEGVEEAGDESPEPLSADRERVSGARGDRAAAGSSATPSASLWRRSQQKEQRGRGAAGLEEAQGVPLPGDEGGGRGEGVSRRHLHHTSASTTGPDTPEPSLPGGESPLVTRGLVLNERTGKTIKIGAGTYNRLVLEGYQLDRAAGVLTPPRGVGSYDSPGASRGRPIRSTPASFHS